MAVSKLMIALLGASSIVPALAALSCRPNVPIVPRPQGLGTSETFNAALTNLTTLFDNVIKGDLNGGFPLENSSFSLAVVSLSQSDPSTPLWEYHRLSPNNINGTKDIDRDSQYLIGSISKVISDLVLLKSGVDVNEPVTEFLPQLGEERSLIEWENIALKDLGNHLSGIPPNYGFSEYYYLNFLFEMLGFPPLEDDEYPTCGVIGLNPGCDLDGLLNGLLEAYPITAPSQQPIYTNIGFTLFIQALQAQTGKTYKEMLDEHIIGPLGLKNTGESPGEDAKAVIPPGESTWGSNYGIDAPGGGLYSSVSDLSALLHGILSRSDKVLPTPKDIRAWLKPASATGSLNTLVGLPWEIFRTTKLTPEHPHVVDIYAKGGGAYGYQSQMAILDDYGLGIVVLTAGEARAMAPLYDAMLTVLTPAADEAARQEAKVYTGTFKNDCGDVPIIAEVKFDRDSIVLESLTRNGSDIIAGITEFFQQSLGRVVGFSVSTPRLFPAEIRNAGTIDPSSDCPEQQERKVVREDWRLWWGEIEGDMESDLPGAGLSGENCLMWTVADWVHYGKEPLDRFVFVRDEEGEFLGLELPFLRSGLLVPV